MMFLTEMEGEGREHLEYMSQNCLRKMVRTQVLMILLFSLDVFENIMKRNLYGCYVRWDSLYKLWL